MRIDTKIGLVLALLGALACGDDGEGGGRVMMTVEVTEVSADEALEGAEICITSHDGYACATTDATGFTTMEAPANAEPVFRVTHPRTVPGLMPVTTTSVDGAFEAEVAEPGLTNILLNLVGITPDATKGNILVLAGGPMGMSGIGGGSLLRSRGMGASACLYAVGYSSPCCISARVDDAKKNKMRRRERTAG